ncbi:DMT family transporter [Clostridium sardiniense]|uniref:DMT family transporter n=1 Tax=Clostridium sardiniense TaxID=29369 RepID=A0ABS7L0L3_CLOSR|nr:DMT family transporter [Clostridium sardiniense]MBY0756600.1 DMT family transporter [Clostridium sardiniense]MDQ0458654.1 drug/metabolite transporter (DMT)-like permease [Clostridium sardiniense]
MNNKKKGITLVLIATLFWGMMGVTSRTLGNAGIDSMSISFFRCLIAAIGFGIFLFIFNKKAFMVDFKGIIISGIYGIVTFGLSFTTFNIAVERVPIAVATVLMFTNPIWVTIFNAIFFKEKITSKKATVIALAIIGCLLISNIFGVGFENLDIVGLLVGLSTGVLFALQLVIPRFFDGKYSKDSMLIYGFIFSTIALAFFTNFTGVNTAITTNSSPIFVILNILSIGILSTFIANISYVKATDYIETGVASVLVALEPVLGSLFAYIVYGETLTGLQLLGGLLIVIAAIWLARTSD